MGIIDLASRASSCRGLEYYKTNKVAKIVKINDNEYKSNVSGSKKYEVYLNIEHARKSTCNCPLADGKRIICKHIVATYFKAFPNDAERFERIQIEAEEEYEKEQEEIYDKIINCLYKMKKDELINEIIDIFSRSPEWVLEDFLRRNYND